MPSIPRLRGQSPAEHAPAPIVLSALPIDLESRHTRRVRKAVGYTRNVATVATAVPFMPLPARVAAGAVTGVASVVDAALRPAAERPAAPARPAPTDDEILHDPALFAADAAGALATGVLAAGEALVVSAKSPLLRRTLKVGAVAAVVVTVGALGYRLVVGPALVRRRERRSRERALIVLPDDGVTALTATEGAATDAQASGAGADVGAEADADAGAGAEAETDAGAGGGEAGIADVLAQDATEPIVEVAVLADGAVESLEDTTAVEAVPDAARKKRRLGRRKAADADATDAAPPALPAED